MNRLSATCAAGLFSLVLVAGITIQPVYSYAESAIQTALVSPSVQVGDAILDRAALQAVYGTRNYEPLWIEKGKIRDRAKTIIAVLTNARVHGLNTEDYNLSLILRRVDQKQSTADLVVLDLLLTDGLMRYASDVRGGRVNPRQLAGEKYIRQQIIDPVEIVLQAAEAPDLEGFLAQLPPHTALYQSQLKALEALRAMPDWVPIATGPKLQKGQTSSRVETLRQRLFATGELMDADVTGTTYDQKLFDAVKAYQIRNGLDADGVIGASTLTMLNIPRSERIDQVIANMERQRWLPQSLGGRHVLVNVPAYELFAVTNNNVDLHMKTIVGRPDRPTPLFADLIRYVEFNPTWGVPPTIAKKDVLPHLRQDPGYALEHKNVRIYRDGVEIDPYSVDWNAANIGRYTLRAPPGPRNPLGQVKFLFPNRFDVYLHDTSERNKFALTERDLSSGCVRVNDPAALSNWLLSDKDGWSDEKRVSILKSERQTRLSMNKPVPVWLTYTTAWMDGDGHPVFRPDIYSYDDDLVHAIEATTQRKRWLVVSMVRAENDEAPVDTLADDKEVPQAAP